MTEADGLKLLFLCPRWGSERLPIAEFLARARAAGYDGVELPFPEEPGARQEVRAALRASGLPFVAQHHETLDADFAAHASRYEQRLRALAAEGPLFVNAHTGRDFFSFEQVTALLAVADRVARETGVAVVHETHRGRFTFAAHATRRYLEAVPGLRLTVDFSHWCAVAESLLQDQPEAVDLAIARADHVHARVGSPETPQVADPRAPDAQEALAAHLGWWDRVVQRHRREGAARLTVTPEFGPPPYMVRLPSTGEPVTDQWAVNVHMMDLLRARWAA